MKTKNHKLSVILIPIFFIVALIFFFSDSVIVSSEAQPNLNSSSNLVTKVSSSVTTTTGAPKAAPSIPEALRHVEFVKIDTNRLWGRFLVLLGFLASIYRIAPDLPWARKKGNGQEDRIDKERLDELRKELLELQNQVKIIEKDAAQNVTSMKSMKDDYKELTSKIKSLVEKIDIMANLLDYQE